MLRPCARPEHRSPRGFARFGALFLGGTVVWNGGLGRVQDDAEVHVRALDIVGLIGPMFLPPGI